MNSKRLLLTLAGCLLALCTALGEVANSAVVRNGATLLGLVLAAGIIYAVKRDPAGLTRRGSAEDDEDSSSESASTARRAIWAIWMFVAGLVCMGLGLALSTQLPQFLLPLEGAGLFFLAVSVYNLLSARR